MQHLREELEKYKDLYDEKCVELEEERSKRNEVCVTAFFTLLCQFSQMPVSLSCFSVGWWIAQGNKCKKRILKN